ncbi:MAG: hypothetical protein IT305_26320 [Chloroflexi bacterium]|nr:hypothetical protein [Chloroflexota bacterium]
MRVMTASTTMVRATPPHIYDWLDGLMHFTIDVCANEENAKHPKFFSEADNGLAQSWEGETFWMNPPYGRQIGGWMAKARDSAMLERAMGLALVPARVDTDWWQNFVMCRDQKPGRLRSVAFVPHTGVHWYRWDRLITGVYFHDERLPFDGMETGAPFPSAMVFYAHPTRRPVAPALASSLPANRDWAFLVEGWPR